jgi:hypothetical protein
VLEEYWLMPWHVFNSIPSTSEGMMMMTQQQQQADDHYDRMVSAMLHLVYRLFTDSISTLISHDDTSILQKKEEEEEEEEAIYSWSKLLVV